MLFTADSLITINNSANLQGVNIPLLAESTVTITNSNPSPGPVDVFAIANADANVNITGGIISASGNLNVEAKNTVTPLLQPGPRRAATPLDRRRGRQRDPHERRASP